MSIRRFIRKCEEFRICAARGDRAGLVLLENTEETGKSLYTIQAEGSGRFSSIFNSEYIEGNANGANFGCMKPYAGKHLIFESYEPFLQYGFNALSPNQDWDGELIKESFDGDDRSWLICFKGNPIINGKELKILDYAKLENKHYDVQLNDTIVGVFTKLDPALKLNFEKND